MRMLVAGGFDVDDPEMTKRVQGFGAALGRTIVDLGHDLLNGCRTRFDEIIAEAAYARLIETKAGAPEKRIVSYVLSNSEPAHALGTVLRSHLADWELDKDTFYIPETIQKSDVIILVGGFEGVLRAANWARIAGKPLLPFTGFGGAARRVYEKELEGFEGKYASLVDQLEYEQLNSVKDNWDEHANDIVALAEKVAMSRKVVAIMSYADDLDLEDVYESFKDVTADLGYRCERVTHENAGSRIVPDILDRIRGAAFTIVDITHLRPNVFYELGYADGLGKKVVVTAKDGTEPPFDISDIPTIFWKNQKGLKVDLRARILQVVPTALPKATPPLGPR